MNHLPHSVVKNIVKQTKIDENLKKQMIIINNNINNLEEDIELQKQNIDKEIEDYETGIINEEEYDIDYLLKDLEKMQSKLGKLKMKKKSLMSNIHKMSILDKNLKGGKKTKKKMRGGNLETIKEENCCNDLELCKYNNKSYQRMIDKITKLYEIELLKQMHN
jgi:hypothetical protein